MKFIFHVFRLLCFQWRVSVNQLLSLIKMSLKFDNYTVFSSPLFSVALQIMYQVELRNVAMWNGSSLSSMKAAQHLPIYMQLICDLIVKSTEPPVSNSILFAWTK